jgi:hypothetical protein
MTEDLGLSAAVIEMIAEVTARSVLKVLAEQAKHLPQEEKSEPLGWQPMAKAAKALGQTQWGLGNCRRSGVLRLNIDYKIAPQSKAVRCPRYVYHIENCLKRLGV